MSDSLQIPDWLKEQVIDKYNSGVSHIFILHFNVNDYFAAQSRYLTLPEILLELCIQREIVGTYNYPAGLKLAAPEMETKFRRLAGVGSREFLPGGANQNL